MELRESVQWFAEQMEIELRKHDDDRGEDWKNDDLDPLFVHLKKEVKELESELEPFWLIAPSAIPEGDRLKIIGEAVDTANMAMMVADVIRIAP